MRMDDLSPGIPVIIAVADPKQVEKQNFLAHGPRDFLDAWIRSTDLDRSCRAAAAMRTRQACQTRLVCACHIVYSR